MIAVGACSDRSIGSRRTGPLERARRRLHVPRLFLLFALFAVSGVAAAVESPAEFESRLEAELRQQSHEAADLFAQANEAREREDHRAAAELYGRVHEIVPGFSHALRRQAYEHVALGEPGKAVSVARRAVAIEASALNLAVLASVLVEVKVSDPKSGVVSPHVEEALMLAKRAVSLESRDAHVLMMYCKVAIAAADLTSLGEGVRRLLGAAPDEPGSHYFHAILAASEGRFEEAESAVARALQLGLPENAAASLLNSIRRAKPLSQRILPISIIVGGAWAGTFLSLLLAGLILSAAALRAARRVPKEPDGRAQGLDAVLRRVYAIVLWLCGVFYYLSLPLLAALVAVAGGGLIYGFFAVGRVPIKLVAIIAAVTLVTLWALLRSLFVRGVDADPGERLDLGQHPKMAALLCDVADRVGTRPVDAVYMTPGTDVAVTERGGLLKQLWGSRERCLILGVGVLEGLRLRPFKAVLAHEYGHFSNRDTAGGGFALAVRRSLVTMAQTLAAGGAATWYSPAWWFVNGFFRVFLRISQGASRLQEVLADRWAAYLYGSKAFEEGLRHVIARSVIFEAHAQCTLAEVMENNKPLANFYTYAPKEPPSAGTTEEAVGAALNAEASAYDSHPRPADRFAWVRAIAAEGEGAEPDGALTAWDLFPNREAIELQLTDVIRANVLMSTGVSISPRAAEGEPPAVAPQEARP